MTGTIRKAQNLLKQYSQHGLDGKKGASNLIPMEGNHSSSYFTLDFLCVSALLSQVGLPLVQCLVDSIGLGNQRDAGTKEMLEGQIIFVLFIQNLLSEFQILHQYE